MSLLSSLRRTPGFNYIGRAYFSTQGTKMSGYHQMLESSDREKVEQIAKTFLQEEQRKQFTSDNPNVSPSELVSLVRMVESTHPIPMEYLGISQDQNDAIHFLDNRTFINLPYSTKVAKWADRNALQSLIRNKFTSLFEAGDLILVPGCADGQIPIEIRAQSLQHEVEIDVVAADCNEVAMKLGYCTMKSYAIDNSRIQWVRADITSSSFFDWFATKLPSRNRHQIVTLIQPSLREESLISFLKKSADLAHKSHNHTTVVMPVLLEDPKTKWYKECASLVEQALSVAKKTKDLPQLVWNKTHYGTEILRLNATKSTYVAQQYFIHPEALSEIQKTTGYADVAQKVFGILPKSKSAYHVGDPRLIESDYSKRVFCIWDVK